MKDHECIRVAIVDDNEMLRTGLSLFLHAFDDLELVGTASDGAEVFRLCEETHPDVVLMDLVMPGMNGVSATHAIRQAYPQIQMILLTSFDDQDLAGDALANGQWDACSRTSRSTRWPVPSGQPKPFRM